MPPSAFWNLPILSSLRAGEAAFAMAEQLAFDQLFGNRRAVHFDERLVRARAVLRGWRARPVPCRCRFRRKSARGRWWRPSAPSCWRSAFIGTLSPMMRSLPSPSLSRSISSSSRRCWHGILHHHGDLLDGQRLFEEIECAQFGGLHRGFDGAVAGDHDHHRPVGEGISWMRASVSMPSMPGSQTSSSTTRRAARQALAGTLRRRRPLRRRSLRPPARRSAIRGCRVRRPPPGRAAFHARRFHCCAPARRQARRHLDDEARAGRLIVLRRGFRPPCSDTMWFTIARPSRCRGSWVKVRQEKLLLVFGRNAAAGVGDSQLHEVAADRREVPT